MQSFPVDHSIKYNIRHKANRCIFFDTQYTGKQTGTQRYFKTSNFRLYFKIIIKT